MRDGCLRPKCVPGSCELVLYSFIVLPAAGLPVHASCRTEQGYPIGCRRATNKIRSELRLRRKSHPDSTRVDGAFVPCFMQGLMPGFNEGFEFCGSDETPQTTFSDPITPAGTFKPHHVVEP